MKADVTVVPLAAQNDWDSIEASISPNKTQTISNILTALQQAGAKSGIIEHAYLDRDFSSAYSHFYSSVFKPYTKVCKRYHFFLEDVSAVKQITDPFAVMEKLKTINSEGKYLGYLVIRPVAHAPLAMAVIAPPNNQDQLNVLADYEVHLLGAELKVRGFPVTQQDSRVGSCAQAAVWMCGRHFHVRHGGAWATSIDINEAATTPIDEPLSRSLPAGSDFLTATAIVRALRDIGRFPLTYFADALPTVNNRQVPQWSTHRPEDVVVRHVDSGIPIILGLVSPTQVTVGHAVAAMGVVYSATPPGQPLQHSPTTAAFADALLVNDDQRGPYLRMPLRAGAAGAQSPFNIQEHLAFVIVPLPNKVFLRAEFAERLAWNLMNQYQSDWSSISKLVGQKMGSSLPLGDALVQALSNKEVVARTYLTFGWKYKARMIANNVPLELKSLLLLHHLPRYVWVTEFSFASSHFGANATRKRVVAHVAIDATSSLYWHCYSVFHAPGVAKTWGYTSSENGSRDETVDIYLSNDAPYTAK